LSRRESGLTCAPEKAAELARCGGAIFANANGEFDVVDYPGCFGWYELMTTDMAGAETFYGNVVGWGAQDASTPNLAYTLFTAGKVPLGGLMDLPEEGRKMGAWPRWMGYVEVSDVEVTAVASTLKIESKLMARLAKVEDAVPVAAAVSPLAVSTKRQPTGSRRRTGCQNSG